MDDGDECSTFNYALLPPELLQVRLVQRQHGAVSGGKAALCRSFSLVICIVVLINCITLFHGVGTPG